MVQLATGTVALHRIAAFMDRGMDPTLISFATAFDAVAAGGSTFLFGMLVRWVPARFLGAFGFSMLAGCECVDDLRHESADYVRVDVDLRHGHRRDDVF